MTIYGGQLPEVFVEDVTLPMFGKKLPQKVAMKKNGRAGNEIVTVVTRAFHLYRYDKDSDKNMSNP
jgi:hypothetical protein